MVVGVTEVHPDGRGRWAAFRSRAAFRREAVETVSLTDGILLDEDTLRVRAAVLDHRIPCLAFALEEKAHVPLGHLKARLLSVTPGQKIGYVAERLRQEARDTRASVGRQFPKRGGKRPAP